MEGASLTPSPVMAVMAPLRQMCIRDSLWGIRFNNERSWFLAHKQDYEAHLLAPTRALGEQV